MANTASDSLDANDLLTMLTALITPIVPKDIRIIFYVVVCFNIDCIFDFWVKAQSAALLMGITGCHSLSLLSHVVSQVKCAQYWPSPDRETEIYEEFIVKLNSEDLCPDYTIRHLSLTNVSLRQ